MEDDPTSHLYFPGQIRIYKIYSFQIFISNQNNLNGLEM